MLKNKKLWIIVVLVLFATSGFAYFSLNREASSGKSFLEDGFLMTTTANAESEKIYFASGTRYRQSEDQITFKDIQKNRQAVSTQSFLHLSNGGTASFAPGVFLDLAEMGADFISHYSTSEQMIVNVGSDQNYTIQSGTETFTYAELIWKLSESQYCILSPELSVVLDAGDPRPVSGFVELKYLDKGVVQIISEDNVWQTVAPDGYIETAQGVRIYPVRQEMVKEDHTLSMTKLVVDADDNIVLQAASINDFQQIIPKFNVTSEDGKQGESGESGESGEAGENGEKGASGANGAPGAWGADAGTTSSSKTEIPVFSIQTWNVTATGMNGSILVTDENGVMVNEDYSMFVVENGGTEMIPVAPVKENGDVENNFSFEDGVTFNFKTQKELKPDTGYTFIVRAYYEMGNYDTGQGSNRMIRDFVTRAFYTDSLGVQISAASLQQNSITIQLDKNIYSTATMATVYLLTPEENLNFDLDAAQSATANYPKKEYTFTAPAGTAETGSVLFENLPSNTGYTARVVITYLDESENKTALDLSQQKVVTTTLKQNPVLTGLPQVASNRSLAAFEIYNVSVSDPDGAISAFRYDIYSNSAGSGGTSAKVKTLEISAETAAKVDPTLLYIDGETIKFNEDYYLIETVVYNDNEKTVEINQNNEGKTMSSSVFSLTGSQSPSVRFVPTDDGVKYDHIHGTLIITKNGADIEYSSEHPITVTIQNEGVFEKTLTFDESNVLPSGSELLLNIDEAGLAADKIYRFAIRAYVNLHEDSSSDIYHEMNVGSIVVSTPAMKQARAVWQATNSGHAISRKLTLVPKNADEDLSYEQRTLTYLKVDLYSGNPVSGTYLGSAEYNDANADDYESELGMRLFTDEGIEISEASFGISAANLTASSYTFVIEAAYDYTYKNSNNGNISQYVNNLPIEYAQSESIGKEEQPPALPKVGDEDNCVTAIPITRKTAAEKYGLTHYNEELPEDTVVGYRLVANYDNYGQLARSIDFYGFESNYFAEQIGKGSNPTDTEDKALFVKNLDVDLTTGAIPSLTVWFGEAPNDGYYEARNDKKIFTIGKESMIYGGSPNVVSSGTNQELAAGVDRGFRYVFAYKVHYSSTGSGVADKVYPEGHPDASAWGVGTKNVLVLNSGMVDMPKQAPTFQSLPLTAQGANLTISYRYKDADHVIQYINKDSTENTSLLLNDNPTQNRITLDECNFEQEGSACEWAETSLTGVTPGTNNVVTIKANSSLYRMNYADVENNLLIYQTPWVTTAPNINMSDTKLNIINTPELLQSNLIQIKVTDTDGNELGGLKNIIIGVELTFKSAAPDAGADETATVFVNLDDELKGSIPTSNLSHLLGKKLKVDAKLISDTMGFGWKNIVAENISGASAMPAVALQQITDGHFSRYYSRLSTGETSLSDRASNSYYQLFKKQVTQDAETQTRLGTIYKPDQREYLSIPLEYSNIGAKLPGENSRTAVVPKILAENPFPADNIAVQNDSLIIQNIIPTASYTSMAVGVNYVYFSGFQVLGIDQIEPDSRGDRWITAKIETVSDNGTTTFIKNQYFKVTDKPFTIKLDELDRDKDYHVTFWARTGTNTSSQLLDSNSAIGAKLAADFTTKKEVTINRVSMMYDAGDYSTKRWNLEFTLSQVSDFRLRYTFEEEQTQDDGSLGWTTIATHEQIVDPNGWHLTTEWPDDMQYNTRMELVLSLTPGNHPFTPGNKYKLKIDAISTKFTDEDGQAEQVGSAAYEFYYPALTMPVAIMNGTPVMDTDNSGLVTKKTYGFDFDVAAIGDQSKIIMSDRGDNKINGNYMVRIFDETGRILNGSGIQIECPTDEGINSLSTLYAASFDSTTPGPVIKIRGLEANRSYKFVVYAALDMNYNGVNDLLENSDNEEWKQKYGKLSMAEAYAAAQQDGVSLFDTNENFRKYFMLNEKIDTTPDEDGFKFGSINLRKNPDNEDLMQVVYRNSSGLENLEKIVVSVIHASGDPASGVVTLSAQDLFTGEALMTYDSGSQRYILSIPKEIIALTKTGDYQVTLQHYADGKIVQSYSNIYEK